MAQRMYDNDYVSVTQALNVLRKLALENWFKYNSAKFCDEESAKGKLVGTQIHEGLHSFIETEEAQIPTQYGEEVKIALRSFIQFRKDYPQIKLIGSEIALTSEAYKYNGTLDCLADDGELVIADWKTSKCKNKERPPIYDEYLFQVSAYVYLYNEVKKTDIKRAYILVLAKDKIAYNFIQLDNKLITDCFYHVFLPALKIYYFQKELTNIKKELGYE